jgi:hypothetical protein
VPCFDRNGKTAFLMSILAINIIPAGSADWKMQIISPEIVHGLLTYNSQKKASKLLETGLLIFFVIISI